MKNEKSEEIRQSFLSFLGYQSVIEFFEKDPIPDESPKVAETHKKIQQIIKDDRDIVMTIFIMSWNECCNANKFLSGKGKDLIKLALKGAPSIEEAFSLGRKLGLSDEEIYNVMEE